MDIYVETRRKKDVFVFCWTWFVGAYHYLELPTQNFEAISLSPDVYLQRFGIYADILEVKKTAVLEIGQKLVNYQHAIDNVYDGIQNCT